VVNGHIDVLSKESGVCENVAVVLKYKEKGERERERKKADWWGRGKRHLMFYSTKNSHEQLELNHQ
jgi:hypothetical protein